ncbi:rap guanine nucleotide exchange factor 4-like isoform X2 [Alosa sapidissima]|uniref:rap guanine nucleotide exchange factor 4-like isoform X2 n=1 Tax=Alosa sapidissima TaxID=34773 RepID=UPI001C098D0E|nr:rap guanine nucleotide exchange factor 4-like isoform X2 [Alosa sapidissima]
MSRLKRALCFLCCLRAETEAEEDHDYTNMLERARLHRETWRLNELARLKIELESQGRVQQPDQASQDLATKASRGDSVEIEDVERKRALEQEREQEERVARLMEIRRQKLQRTFQAEKLRMELAAVMVLQSEVRMGTVLISQGVNGTSNYVIWKGSANIISNRKGVMTTLHEGQDLLAPFKRRPQVVRPEHVCHFLRVGNRDFMSILKDVNANMVHVEEKGEPALILKRSSEQVFAPGAPEHASCSNKFLVKLGTPDTILQFLLFSMNPDTPDDQMDPFVCSFLLTYYVFMTPEELCSALLKHLHSEPSVDTGLVQVKERVVTLVVQWVALYGLLLLDNPAVVHFLEKLSKQVKGHAHLRMLRDYISARRYLLLDNGQWTKNQTSNRGRQVDWSLVWNKHYQTTRPIRMKDKVLLKVYRHDHSFTSVRMPLNASVEDVMAALKAPVGDNMLIRLKSSGAREQLKMDARAISILGINERLFLCSASQAAELTPLQGQLGPKANRSTLENMSAKAMAAQLTSYDWELFSAMHETELLYYVLGRKQFPNSLTANLERFIRRFNVVTYWVVTELCLCAELSKRARLMRKFIKMATVLYREKNMNSFMAVMYGLTNSAVSRLHKTWKKVPKAQLKRFRQYELILDPFRNHDALRQVVAKLDLPYIPYLPLILKDLTFINEGNKTRQDNLVNFEKMNLFAKTLKIVKDCRNQPYLPIVPQRGGTKKGTGLHNIQKPSCKKPSYPEQFHNSRKLHVISDQLKLTQLSRAIEL